jgi:hypothetical protein
MPPSLQLSDHDKTVLLQRLPAVDLSYAPLPPHKKVLGNLFLAIPRGLKCLLWFTYWQDQNICVVLPLNERGNINMTKIFVTAACFNGYLARGSLFYGTLFTHHPSAHKQRCFTLENVFWYMGHDFTRSIWEQKLNVFRELMQAYIMQKAYTQDFILIGLPVITSSLDALQTHVAELPYECFGFEIYHAKMCEKVGFIKVRPNVQAGNLSAVFAVKALPDQDMYNIFLDATLASPHGIAAVPTFQDSVMLNRLFRHVRENANLDLLEESEDEEDMDRGDAVDVDRVVRMRCVYLPRFGKWKPTDAVSSHAPLTPVADVRAVEMRSGHTRFGQRK